MITSINPSNGQTVWEGNPATQADVDNAFSSAQDAFTSWSQLDLSTRQQHLFDFAKAVQDQKDELAQCISEEMGKPLWESLTEIQGVISKIAVSIEAYNDRCKEFAAGPAITRFKPHGVVSVFGSYNFPMHIANGHIVPALLAGNTILFKPSNLTPKCGELYTNAWKNANLPNGVLNLIQGDREIGQYIVSHPKNDGVYFTGSVPAGISINKALADRPDKIIALELGGNNPLVVHEVEKLQAAAYLTLQSAYITSGQRCTCARRLILPKGPKSDQFLDILIQLINKITIGDPLSPVFMGPVISESFAKSLLETQSNLLNQGAKPLVELKHLKPNTGFVSPGLIDVTNIQNRQDNEIFGPLLQVIQVENFNQAIQEANNTQFGLSAGIFTDNPNLYEKFRKNVHAGLINWNQKTTGASSSAPFGGVGLSGNHRPTAYFAADYCSYPVVSIEHNALELPNTLSPGIQL